MAANDGFEIELVRVERLAPSVRELVFERRDGRPIGHAPGQWLNLVLPVAGAPIRRAYSIASGAPDGARFELAVTLVDGGVGSSWLSALEPGARLEALGPQGFFTREGDDLSPALFVATGTGVTPLRAMLHAAVARGLPAPITLLLGVRREADLLYRDELEALAARHPGFRFVPTLSRPEPGWTGRTGWVQAHVPALVDELATRGAGAPHVWVVGLERMVKAVREVARKQLGLPRERVHSERFD